ncbi:MAG: hypothetical protein OEZ15_08775 [Gammaproteobacteria bacterium]|nr:hypothetical protein [Gammaproteobacteria bacterium]
MYTDTPIQVSGSTQSLYSQRPNAVVIETYADMNSVDIPVIHTDTHHKLLDSLSKKDTRIYWCQ